MMHSKRSSITRRGLLRSVGAVSLAAPLAALGTRHALGVGPDAALGFGPLAPMEDETTGLPLLKLPRGFRYRTFGWTGDLMSDGTLTPDRHDGMAVVDIAFNRRGAPELSPLGDVLSTSKRPVSRSRSRAHGRARSSDSRMRVP